MLLMKRMNKMLLVAALLKFRKRAFGASART